MLELMGDIFKLPLLLILPVTSYVSIYKFEKCKVATGFLTKS